MFLVATDHDMWDLDALEGARFSDETQSSLYFLHIAYPGGIWYTIYQLGFTVFSATASEWLASE